MPFNRVIESLDIIQQLSDLPNEDDNLTADELKARFDKGVNILKEYVFSFIDELESPRSANNIGYDGAHPNVGEALKALESAGVGTIPPDNTISTDKLQNGSVTEMKLALELANKINAVNVKFGELKCTYTGDNTTDNGTNSIVRVDKYQEHDIGIEASIVLLFKCGEMHGNGIEIMTNTKTYLYGLSIGEDQYNSSAVRHEYIQYGGIATKEKACMCNNKHEVFRIEGSKIITHRYRYYASDAPAMTRYDIGKESTLYYLAFV